MLLSPLAQSYPDQVLGYFDYAAILLHADTLTQGRLLCDTGGTAERKIAAAMDHGRLIKKLVQKLRKVEFRILLMVVVLNCFELITVYWEHTDVCTCNTLHVHHKTNMQTHTHTHTHGGGVY